MDWSLPKCRQDQVDWSVAQVEELQEHTNHHDGRDEVRRVADELDGLLEEAGGAAG